MSYETDQEFRELVSEAMGDPSPVTIDVMAAIGEVEHRHPGAELKFDLVHSHKVFPGRVQVTITVHDPRPRPWWRMTMEKWCNG